MLKIAAQLAERLVMCCWLGGWEKAGGRDGCMTASLLRDGCTTTIEEGG